MAAALALAALGGWAVAALAVVAAVRLRRRLELVGDAAHELRGPATALVFAVAALRRDPAAARWAPRIDGQLDRLAVGLADLEAARSGCAAQARREPVLLERVVRTAVDAWRAPFAAAGRDLALCWEAGPEHVAADPGRLAQALGNLLANAAEHGRGPVAVSVFRSGAGTVRIEVRDAGGRGERRAPAPGRGRGLRIARRAARAAGGELTLDRGAGGTVAALGLPRTRRAA